MNQSPKEVLIAARKLIEPRESWGQSYSYERPGTYCAAEALDAAAPHKSVSCEARLFIEHVNNMANLVYFNDHHPHAEVLSAFDRAIAACDGSGAP